jgi:hypothetical protein
MTKEPKSAAELTELIRAHASALEACRQCAVGDVYGHPRDENDCNWGVSQLQGSGCFECLSLIKPFLESLYDRFDLQV